MYKLLDCSSFHKVTHIVIKGEIRIVKQILDLKDLYFSICKIQVDNMKERFAVWVDFAPDSVPGRGEA